MVNEIRNNSQPQIYLKIDDLDRIQLQKLSQKVSDTIKNLKNSKSLIEHGTKAAEIGVKVVSEGTSYPNSILKIVTNLDAIASGFKPLHMVENQNLQTALSAGRQIASHSASLILLMTRVTSVANFIFQFRLITKANQEIVNQYKMFIEEVEILDALKNKFKDGSNNNIYVENYSDPDITVATPHVTLEEIKKLYMQLEELLQALSDVEETIEIHSNSLKREVIDFIPGVFQHAILSLLQILRNDAIAPVLKGLSGLISNTVYFIFNTFYFTKSLLKVSDLRAYRESFQGFTAKVDKKAEDSKKVMTEKEKEIFNDLKKIIETKINFENLSNNFQALFKGSALTLSITTLTISAVLAVLAALSIMTGTAPLVFALTILPGIVALTVLAAEYGLGLKISPAKTLSITYPLRIAYRQLMLSWYTYQQQKVERLSKIDHSRPATADDYTTKIKKHETRLKELEKEYASRAWKDLANYGRWQKEDTTAFSRGLAEILADTEYKNLTRETQKLLHQMRIDEQLLKPSEDESAENKNARIAKIELQIQSFALESSSSITKRALKNIPEKLPDIEPWINLEIPE